MKNDRIISIEKITTSPAPATSRYLFRLVRFGIFDSRLALKWQTSIKRSGDGILGFPTLEKCGIGLLLEPCEEAAFLLLSVKEVVVFDHDTLIASAAQCLDCLRHALVVVTLALVFGAWRRGGSSIAYLSSSYAYARLLPYKCYSLASTKI